MGGGVLYAVVLLQCIAVLWLHYEALRRNTDRLRGLLAQPRHHHCHEHAGDAATDGAVAWVPSLGPFTLTLCAACIRRVAT